MIDIRRRYDRLPKNTRIRIRSLLPAGVLRWYANRKTEAYLLSYPKCGRTWLRLMLGKALTCHYSLPEEEDILFLRTNRKIHPNVPSITVVHDDNPMLKSPQELEVTKGRYKNKLVIFLVRDPRDVIISSYFEVSLRSHLFGENPHENRQPMFEGGLSDFIDREVGGFDTILAYYRIWANNRHIPRGFLLVRYEDLKTNPQSELRRILDFLGLNSISDQTIYEAVTFASFENMRRMETENRFRTGVLNAGDHDDLNSYKTRKGEIKGFIEYLSQTQIDELNQRMAASLPEFFGYSS
jgi:hypothetical protein